MSKLFAILFLAAVIAVASAQYYGGLGYSRLGYAASPLANNYNSYQYNHRTAGYAAGYGGLVY